MIRFVFFRVVTICGCEHSEGKGEGAEEGLGCLHGEETRVVRGQRIARYGSC
jgi:hypothetical protein